MVKTKLNEKKKETSNLIKIAAVLSLSGRTINTKLFFSLLPPQKKKETITLRSDSLLNQPSHYPTSFRFSRILTPRKSQRTERGGETEEGRHNLPLPPDVAS